MPKTGFDIRIVTYEYIHNIDPKDETALVAAVDPKPHEKILDAFCGYGAAGKNCLKKEHHIELWLNDESNVQMKRARENIPNIPSTHFIVKRFSRINFSKNVFDKIIIKMGLHEVPKKEQISVAKKAFDILKPKGRLILWDIMTSKETQPILQRIIRKKDEIAGYNKLTRERYFFREDEFLSIMTRAGFSKATDYYTIKYQFSTRKRLEPELKNDQKKLEQLNAYIRKVFPQKLKRALNYDDTGDDIQFTITKKIYIMEKSAATRK